MIVRSDYDRAHTPFFDRDWSVAELMLAAVVMARGVAILFFGGMLSESYEPFRWLSNEGWGVLHIAGAGFWIAGVLMNGSVHRSPVFRMLGCGTGIVLFGLLAAHFVLVGSANAIAVYSAMLGCAALAFIKARADWVRRRHA